MKYNNEIIWNNENVKKIIMKIIIIWCNNEMKIW